MRLYFLRSSFELPELSINANTQQTQEIHTYLQVVVGVKKLAKHQACTEDKHKHTHQQAHALLQERDKYYKYKRTGQQSSNVCHLGRLRGEASPTEPWLWQVSQCWVLAVAGEGQGSQLPLPPLHKPPGR